MTMQVDRIKNAKNRKNMQNELKRKVDRIKDAKVIVIGTEQLDMVFRWIENEEVEKEQLKHIILLPPVGQIG
eukprot:UN25183